MFSSSRTLSQQSLSLFNQQSRTLVYRWDLSLWWLSLMSTRCWWSGMSEWVHVQTALLFVRMHSSFRIDVQTRSTQNETSDSWWRGDDDYRSRTATDHQFSEHGRGLRLFAKETSTSTSVYLFARIDQWRLGTLRHGLSSLWQLADKSTRSDRSGHRRRQWAHAHHKCSTESVITLISSSSSSFSLFRSFVRSNSLLVFLIYKNILNHDTRVQIPW